VAGGAESMRAAKHDERGAVAVEAALLVVIVVVPLLIGVIDLSRAWLTSVQLRGAAANGAMHAIVQPCEVDVIEDLVEQELADPTGVTVTVVDANTGAAPSSCAVATDIRVTATAPVGLTAPGILFFLPDPIQVAGTHVVRTAQ
jgi:Flp pilus assembly pilin Flp